jgi:4-hydroxybenzoate polyprenyltransferase
MLGITFGWGALLGIPAATGRLSWVMAWVYAAAIAWILGYDTIYAHQDREDDAMIGVRSTARLFAERTAPFLAACYAATILLLAGAGWQAGLRWPFFPALLLPAWLLTRQVRRLDIHDPALCLALFRSNREVGLAVAAALLLGRS